MKYALFKFILTVLICTALSVLLSNYLLRAGTEGGDTITIMATVRPQRLIVVDENLTIEQILSNTAQEVRPIVVLGSADGAEIPYSEAIVQQYLALKPTLDFSRPGIVYDRQEESLWRRLMAWWQ